MRVLIPSTHSGVAKKANVVAVKVLDDLGNGTISDMYEPTLFIKNDNGC